MITGVPGPAVNRDHVTRLEAAARRGVVRDGTVGAAGHDRVERRFFRTGVHHGALDEHRQLPLGHPGPDLGHHLVEGGAGDRAGPGDQGNLRFILGHPQRFHHRAERYQFQVTGLGERRVPLHRHFLGLEAQPSQPGVLGHVGEGQLDVTGVQQREVRAVALRGPGVPGIRGQHRRPVGGHQEGRVGAGQAGEVADVDQRGDERRIRVAGGHRRAQALTAQGMSLGHPPTVERPPPRHTRRAARAPLMLAAG